MIVIVITPTAVPPLLLAVPADCLGSERIHIDRWCVDVVSSSGGTKT